MEFDIKIKFRVSTGNLRMLVREINYLTSAPLDRIADSRS